jgi:group II intron reverse transcriptase/maturase
MIFVCLSRTQPITREAVWSGWKHVRQGSSGKGGVDGVSVSMIDANPRKYLYPLWNRLSSGSYMPLAVQEVNIPKSGGGIRQLGIPTLCDRVAQEVIRRELEKIVEPLFHSSSFGYRPHKSAFDAIAQCERHCNERWYVVDIDIKGYFDNIDHNEMMRILRKYTDKSHILLYCQRWLQAPIQRRDKSTIARTKGTPQGGVISPLLSNLFLHEVFDLWMQENHGIMVFERYCDDIIIHTRSIAQSNYILDKVKQRFGQHSLSINAEKTKIVYCYRSLRSHKESKEISGSFDFLGYTFKPRKSVNHKGEMFCGFGAAISITSASKILQAIRSMSIPRRTTKSLQELATYLRPKLLGWIHYYGRHRLKQMSRVFQTLNHRIVRYIQNRYKYSGYRRAKHRLQSIIKHFPNMFVHWQYGFIL